MAIKFISHLLVIMSVFCFYVGYAHDTDKAYFKIEKDSDNVIVFAEFPWSIRKVLDNFKTDISLEKQDLQLKLTNYLKSNLILEDQYGNILPFVSNELIKKNNDGHHSMVNYKIIFEGNDLYKITNTVMCDYFKSQLNFHSLANQNKDFVTSNSVPTFIIKQENEEVVNVIVYYAIFSLLTLVVILFLVKNKIITGWFR